MSDKSFEDYEESDCLANQLGLAKRGDVSSDAVQQLIDRRVDVGKRGRERFGRLVCQAEGCDAVCNVEIIDGIPQWRSMRQGFALIDTCLVLARNAIEP